MPWLHHAFLVIARLKQMQTRLEKVLIVIYSALSIAQKDRTNLKIWQVS